MIATHNIKVNGKWVLAGEEYEPEVTQMQIPVEPVKEAPAAEAPVAEPEKAEEPKTAPKPRTNRKTTRK